MSGISLLQAQTKLDEWLAADSAVSKGQSYEIAGRKLTRSDAKEIRNNIEFWNGWVVKLSNKASGRSRSRTVVVGG